MATQGYEPLGTPGGFLLFGRVLNSRGGYFDARDWAWVQEHREPLPHPGAGSGSVALRAKNCLIDSVGRTQAGWTVLTTGGFRTSPGHYARPREQRRHRSLPFLGVVLGLRQLDDVDRRVARGVTNGFRCGSSIGSEKADPMTTSYALNFSKIAVSISLTRHPSRPQPG